MTSVCLHKTNNAKRLILFCAMWAFFSCVGYSFTPPPSDLEVGVAELVFDHKITQPEWQSPRIYTGGPTIPRYL